MTFRKHQINFQVNYLHEFILLAIVGAVSCFELAHSFLGFSAVSFVFQSPVSSFFLFVSSLGIGTGLVVSPYVQRHRERLLMVLSSLFCIYLAVGIFQCGFNVILVRLFWVFLAMSGSYFLKYHYVTSLLAVAYVSMGIVHLALPAGAIGYPVWMYMFFAPLLMLAFFYVVSQSIFNHRRLQESERNLLAKTKELNTILDSLNAMVAFKNKENTYVAVNRAMAEFFGKRKEEIIGRKLNELLEGEDAERYFSEDKKIIEKGQPIQNTLERLTRPSDGSEIWLKNSKTPLFGDDGEVVGLVFSGEEVTEQVLAEQKLKSSEERFRMLFEKAPDGMGLIAISSHTFVKVNQALAKMVGLHERELIGKSPSDIAHPEDRYLTLPLFREAVKNDLTEYATEQRLQREDGTVIICRLSAHIVREGGKPKYLICLFQDVTRKRENEERLKLYAEQLEESNQNLQEFAYAASHDLREPLRTVVSYVQLLQKYLDMDEQKPEVHEFMAYIVDGSRRMEKQITALLQYSRVGRGELVKQTVDMNRSLEIVKASLYAQIKENDAEVTFDELPTVLADQSQIGAVLQNLISNSLKYQKRGVRPRIHISSLLGNEGWVISVKDNGIGIEAEQLEKVFAVFRRLHTQDEYPGSGVGLAICRRIIKRHGGRIWAESEPGKGTTFFFTIPHEEEAGTPDVAKNTLLLENQI